MITGIVIPSDKEQPLKRVEFEHEDIKFIQGVVQGWFECLDVEDITASLWFNEEGKLFRLPVNERATALLWMYRPEFGLANDRIVGDVLVTGVPNEDADTTSVPEELTTLLMETTSFKLDWQFKSSEAWSGQNIFDADWPSVFTMGYMVRVKDKNIARVRVTPA